MPLPQVSPDLQQDRDIQAARVMQAEAQNPVDEAAVAKDLGSVPYNIQVAAQTKDTAPWSKPSQETAPWAKSSSDKGSSNKAPWDKEEPKKDEGFWSDIGRNALGGLAAAGDFLGAIPGSIMAGASVFAPPENEQTGDTLEQVAERAKKGMESTMPSTYFPEIKENRGYQAASDLLAKPIEYGTKGIRGAAMLPYMTGIMPWLLDKTGIAESPTGNYLEEGQKFASDYLNDKPEMAPGLSATSDILGMMAGYGALGMRPKGETPLPEYGRTGREPGARTIPEPGVNPMGAEPTLGTVPSVETGGGGLAGGTGRDMLNTAELPQGLAGKEPTPGITPEVTNPQQEPIWQSSPVDLAQQGKVEPVIRQSPEEIALQRLKDVLDRKDIFEKRTNTTPTEPLAFGDENRIRWEPTEIERPNPEAATGASPTETSQFVQAGENIGDRRGFTNTPMQSIDPRSPDYNPNLLQEPPRTHDTLDILTPILEDRGVSIEKANQNKTLKSLTGQLDEHSNYIETLLEDRKPVPEIQKAIQEWENLADRTATKAEEISRKAESGQKKETILNPTRPGSPFKGPGKNQAGGFNPEIFRDALDRIKRGWAAMMEIQPPKLGEPEEGGGAMIARGIAEARKSPTPPVFYSGREISNKGPRGRQTGAIKLPGGMWSKETIEDLASSLWANIGPRNGLHGENSKQIALENWAEKTINNYLNKYAGTDRDPLKDMRIPMFGDTARWEDITDKVFKKGKLSEERGKLSPSTIDAYRNGRITMDEPIWHDRYDRDRNGEPGDALGALKDYISHVGDYLREHVSPEKQLQYDFVRAARETAAQDVKQAKKMEHARISGEGTIPYKEYPDGMKWVEVKSADALKNEGDVMGHCVGGYCEAVHNGRSKIYSLRDKRGMSHVTIEVEPKDPFVHGNKLPQEIYKEYLIQNKRTGITLPEFIKNNHPDLFEYIERDKSDIIQIKGKQNRAPSEVYQPYVQDFVKSGDWGHISDLQNAGLMNKREAFNLLEDIINSNRSIPHEERVGIKEQIKAELDAGGELGKKYFSPDDTKKIEEKYNLFKNDTTSINRGPGGKQSGAIKPEVFLEGIRKGTKSLEEFTKKLVDELGEEFRPLASSLYNRKEETPQVKQELPPSNSKSNLPKSISKHLIGDTRTAEQFAKEEKANGFGENINPYTKGTELLPLSYIAARSKESPTINWMYTKLTGLDDSLGIKKDMAKNGEKFAPNWRGSFERHVKSDDGAMTVLNRLPKTDRQHAMDTFFDRFEGKEGVVDEKALLDAGLNKTQAKGILAARTWLDRFAKEYNEDAKAAGEPEISFLPNYMPHVWRGKFKILIKQPKVIDNATGEVVQKEKLIHVVSAETSGEARTMAEEMRKVHPEYLFEEPKINRGKYDTGSIQAYKEAKEFLDKGSPEAAILDKTFNDILARRGYRKATLNRSGVGGYDTDAGIIGDYLDKGYNFLYNQKKRRAFSELMKAMQAEGFDLAKEHPDTHGYLLDVLNQSVHGLEDGLQQLTHIGESVGMAMDKISHGKVGNPETVSDTIRSLNGLASASFLGTPFFIMVQPLQLLFLVPKAIQLKLASRAPEASYMSLKQSILPDDYAKEAMSWAVRNGKIQSKAMELLDLKAGNPRTWAGKAPIWYTNNVLGKADSSLTRIPAFFFFDSLLKNEIPNKQDRWFKAALLGNDTMVNYSHTNRPLALGRMGDVVGPALRPFTQFPISYAGQILSYLKDAKSAHGAAAVAAFLAMQYIQGGLNGMVGIQDANKIIEAVNDIFKTDIDTPERLLATQDWAGNSVRYGPFATLTGLNYSSTTAAPTILNPPSVPGLSMASNLGQGVYHGIKAMTPEGTEADKMEAAIRIAPKIFHSGIEKYFTKPGLGTPNPKHNMDTDTGPRTDKDWTARFLGSRSPEEATEKMRIGAAKKEIQKFNDRRGELVNVMIDRLAEGKEIEDSIKDKYIKYDGNPNLLAKELVNGLIDRNKKWAYRYLGNIQGLSGAQKAQRLKEFNLLIQDEPLEKQIETLKELNNAR